MNFKDWAPLKLVAPELLKQVRLAYVFGKGHDAFIITEDDEVLALGTNNSECLGLEEAGFHYTPKVVPQLSKKKVKGFSSCTHSTGVFVCAYTFSGTLYFWGKNFIQNDFTKTPLVMQQFSPTIQPPKKVSEVECGFDHCLALTSDGQVFSWGYNNYGQLGHNSSTNTTAPTIVQGYLKDRIVTKVSCGTYFSVAVLDNGEVYSWGSNTSGQLGVSSQQLSYIYSPQKISELTGVIIRKISCGESFVLAINDVSELYSWGKNDVGQLGSGNTTSRFAPTQIQMTEKVIRVATTSTGSIAAAMTESFKVYMWGKCGEINILEPKETPFESLYEVFAYFANPRVMYKPITRQFEAESVNESLKFAFGDVETSDLTIVAEDKKIFVHKVILKIRSNYFKLLLQEPWMKEDQNVIPINQKYEGIHAYLKYIYTGELKATPEVALELLKIADEYHDLVLKKVCEKCIKHGITTQNVANLYILALKLNAKKLAKHCLLFASNHIGQLIKTPGFFDWDKETLTEFIVECHKRKLFRS